ncbi:MAG TPA: hypothetical protein PLU50_00735 [Pseudobdellovibrionaceae bacterium]|nr:hypothetical protein [Pseudobdellovibrionaceae bacterium]
MKNKMWMAATIFLISISSFAWEVSYTCTDPNNENAEIDLRIYDGARSIFWKSLHEDLSSEGRFWAYDNESVARLGEKQFVLTDYNRTSTSRYLISLPTNINSIPDEITVHELYDTFQRVRVLNTYECEKD